MSIKLMSAAWEMDLPQSEKMVLLCLCDHANDDGFCWPSVARLARKCSVTDRTIQAAIKGLRNRGILDWEDVPGRSHKFVIDPRSICTPENASPPKMAAAPPKQFHPTPENASDKPSVTIKEPSKSDFDFSDFQESWNEVASLVDLPKLVKATNARKRAFNARRKEFPEIESWRAAFRTLRKSKFLRGEVKPDWRADPDFFLQSKSFTKCVEGSYA